MSVTTAAVPRQTSPQVTIDARHAAHAEMVRMTEALIAEYAGRIPAGSVMRCVARCREHLLHAGVRAGLVPATEAAARVKLRALISARPTS